MRTSVIWLSLMGKTIHEYFAIAVLFRFIGDSGWIQDPSTKNTKRFHLDKKRVSTRTKIFIDSGRSMPDEHPLLKSRSHVDLLLARQLWRNLKQKGWKRVSPQWGLDVDV